MSRYVLLHLKGPNIKIVVGWDNPLQTYFFQRINEDKDEDDEDRINPWKGTSHGEIPSVEDLVRELAPYAVLTAELIAKLRHDKESSRPLSPLQLQMKNMFNG